MIKILHTSDWHLGRLLYGKSLLEEQAYALTGLLELIDKTKPDALLIAGDVFDRALPPEAAVQLFDWFCSEAVLKRQLPVFVIPGNHDSNERIGFGSALLRTSGLTIFSRIEDALKPVRLKGADGTEAMIYGLPFLEPAMIARFLNNESLKTPDEVTRALVKRILTEHPVGLPSILLCHAYVVGGEGSDSERDLFIGGSAFVSSEAFEGLSYVALGHLHKPQTAGQLHIRYSGSLLTYSKSEVEHSKSVTEISMAADGTFETAFHSLPVRRALRYFEGSLGEIVSSAEKFSALERDAYVIIGLTDSGPVLDALARLRAVFPNVLHVARAGGYVPATLPSLAKARERETLSDLDLFAEFFTETTSLSLSADERTALIDAITTVSNADRDRSP
jgi:exonuclease SbcD